MGYNDMVDTDISYIFSGDEKVNKEWASKSNGYTVFSDPFFGYNI